MTSSAKPPKVQVFPPSKKECKSNKDEKIKTLVCLASGFYPDHVTISWQINGFNEKHGVIIDDAAKNKSTGLYTITSRLRVPAEKWMKKGSNVTCIVNFFDGNNTTPYSNWALGPGSEATREKFLRLTQKAKLSYTVLVLKSSIYGLFVVLLLWKLQASSKKC